MIALVQRSAVSSIVVNQEVFGEIQHGIVALIGIGANDTERECKRLVQRMLNYRIFPDENGRMNLSVRDTKGGVLLIPQFTLCADTQKGNRPSFSSAAPPDHAKQLFNRFVDYCKAEHDQVATGIFGADMLVNIQNDGPVTFWLEI